MTMKTTAGEWCSRCHHMLTWFREEWHHADRADWEARGQNYSDCGCVEDGRSCIPESERAVRKTRVPSNRMELEPAGNGRWRLAHERQMRLYMAGGGIGEVPLSFAVGGRVVGWLRDAGAATGRLGGISREAAEALTEMACELPPEEPAS